MKGRAEEEDYTYNGEASEEDDWGTTHNKTKGKGSKAARGGSKPCTGGARTRPTNNQLQYKACFRWQHDSCKLQSTAGLLLETDPCPSVTSCFLQVLQVLHNAEQLKSAGPKRNILQILSTNTRRTKVVELSSGTHRVPDELKKHYLSDGEGGQYSTNLDRNRYGNDDNYLFTVIRYDLEFLGWCPCMVDVEIIDAKAGNSSTIVQCGVEACMCSNKSQHVASARAAAAAADAGAGPRHVQHVGDPELSGFRTAPSAMTAPIVKPKMEPSQQQPMQQAMQQSQHNMALHAPPLAFSGFAKMPQQPTMPMHMMPGSGLPSPQAKRLRRGDSPRRSNSGVSGLFDVLVMAATGEGAEGAAAAGVPGEPPVTSAFNVLGPSPPGLAGGVGDNAPLLGRSGPLAAMPGVGPAAMTAAATTAPQQLLGGARFVSTGGTAAMAGPSAPVGAMPAAGPDAAAHARPRRAPPIKTRSRLWSALSQGELDSLQNALDAYVKTEEEIVSKPFGGLGEGLLPQGPAAGAIAEPPARTRRRKPPRGNSSFLLLAADSMGGFSGLSKLGISLGFKETSDDNLREELSKDSPAVDTGEAGGENGAEAKEGGGEGADDEGTPSAQRRRHVRHVPRQFSSVNVTARVGAAEIKRMAAELEALREENRSLREGARGGTGGSAGLSTLGPSRRLPGNIDAATTSHLFSLEQELLEVRAEIQALGKRCQAAEEREAAANERTRQAEERSTALTMELAKSRAEVNVLMSKLVGVGMAGTPGMQQSMTGSSASALAMFSSAAAGQHHNGKSSLGGHPSSNALDTLSAQLAQLQQQQAAAAGTQAAAMAAAMQHSAAAALASQQRPSASAMSAQTSAASVMALLGKGAMGGFGAAPGAGTHLDQGASAGPSAFHLPPPHAANGPLPMDMGGHPPLGPPGGAGGAAGAAGETRIEAQ